MAQEKVLVFLVLTFALSTPFYIGIISAGTVNVAGGHLRKQVRSSDGTGLFLNFTN